jgi:hypothetical protein
VKPDIDVVTATSRITGAGEADVDAQRVRGHVRQRVAERVDDSHQGRTQPDRAQLGRPAGRRERAERDERDSDVDQHDEPDPGEEAPREVAPGLARLLGEIRDRLEAGVRQHRQRQRKQDLVPARVRPDGDVVGKRVAGEQEREAEHDEQQLRQQVEDGDDDPVAVEGRAAYQAHGGDPEHDGDADHDVPRVVLERLHVQRRAPGSAA